MATLTKALVDKSGGFVSGELVKREISWIIDGEEFKADVFIKPLAFNSAISWLTGKSGAAERLAYSVCDENGTPIFTADEVEKLNESLSVALFAAVGSASGLDKAKTETRKNSNPKKKSGTS